MHALRTERQEVAPELKRADEYSVAIVAALPGKLFGNVKRETGSTEKPWKPFSGPGAKSLGASTRDNQYLGMSVEPWDKTGIWIIHLPWRRRRSVRSI